jgi:hypothetical protein
MISSRIRPFRPVPLFLFVGLFALATGAQNLLTDPGFENGGAAWQMNTSGGRSIVNNVAHTGTHSEQMVIPGVAFPRAVWQTVTDTVIGGTLYNASGWMKTDAIARSSAQIMILWFNSRTPTNNQVPANFIRIDTVGVLAGTHPWTNVSATVTAPVNAVTTQVYLECTAAANDTGTAWFDDLSFQVLPPVPPRLVSAFASDNVIPQIGIDNDDYVLLTFDKAVNNVTVTALNIDSIFPLSNGHTWLSGFGTIGSAVWNPNFVKLLITLSTTISAPTIAVGDTIGFASGSGQATLTGSFDAALGTRQSAASSPARALRITQVPGSIVFSYPEQVKLQILNVQGRCMAMLGSGTGFTWNYADPACRAPAGFYVAQLLKGNDVVACKKILVP